MAYEEIKNRLEPEVFNFQDLTVRDYEPAIAEATPNGAEIIDGKVVLVEVFPPEMLAMREYNVDGSLLHVVTAREPSDDSRTMDVFWPHDTRTSPLEHLQAINNMVSPPSDHGWEHVEYADDWIMNGVEMHKLSSGHIKEYSERNPGSVFERLKGEEISVYLGNVSEAPMHIQFNRDHEAATRAARGVLRTVIASEFRPYLPTIIDREFS